MLKAWKFESTAYMLSEVARRPNLTQIEATSKASNLSKSLGFIKAISCEAIEAFNLNLLLEIIVTLYLFTVSKPGYFLPCWPCPKIFCNYIEFLEFELILL